MISLQAVAAAAGGGAAAAVSNSQNNGQLNPNFVFVLWGFVILFVIGFIIAAYIVDYLENRKAKKENDQKIHE